MNLKLFSHSNVGIFAWITRPKRAAPTAPAHPQRPLNWALSFNSSMETKLSEAGPVSSKTELAKKQALKIEAWRKKWEVVMGKGMVYTICRGINKQTYSHLHPPQFFLLIRMWIRGGKK